MFFEPWQDRDKVRAEVQAARKGVPGLDWKPPANRKLKRVDETQAQWIIRRDGK